MPKFIVHEPIWSRKHRAYFQPGDVIEFDSPAPLEGDVVPDPDQPDLPMLMDMGVLELVPEPVDPEPTPDIAKAAKIKKHNPEASQEDTNG
ncbi:MAG: hypothetical protein P4L50_03270 [Anaerolineaceae bacterium]|nr:hypothetical protein [Anaerolineaceae bacterium]